MARSSAHHRQEDERAMGWDLRRRHQEGAAGGGGFVMEMEDITSRQRPPSQRGQMSGTTWGWKYFHGSHYIMLVILSADVQENVRARLRASCLLPRSGRGGRVRVTYLTFASSCISVFQLIFFASPLLNQTNLENSPFDMWLHHISKKNFLSVVRGRESATYIKSHDLH